MQSILGSISAHDPFNLHMDHSIASEKRKLQFSSFPRSFSVYFLVLYCYFLRFFTSTTSWLQWLPLALLVLNRRSLKKGSTYRHLLGHMKILLNSRYCKSLPFSIIFTIPPLSLYSQSGFSQYEFSQYCNFSASVLFLNSIYLSHVKVSGRS